MEPRHDADVHTEREDRRTRLAIATPDSPAMSGWASYAQCDEDGILRECLDRVGRSTSLSRTFVEIGCSDGLENNTHQLLLDGFAGCWIDGDPAKIAVIDRALGGRRFERLWVRESLVTAENVVQVISEACAYLGTRELDLLSVDVDGNDTHLVRNVLGEWKPKVLSVEYNAKYAPPTSLEMAYDRAAQWDQDDYFGASLQAWVDLLEGYRLVACSVSGVNAFFVRADLTEGFTAYEVDSLYQPPRYWLAGGPAGHPPSLKWLRQSVAGTERDPGSLIDAAVPEVGHFEFEVHEIADEYVSGDLRRDRIWEPLETEVFRLICQPGDRVLDIGANIGWYSVVLSRLVGSEGAVTAFEPDARNLEILRRNIARSAGAAPIEVVPAGVGAADEPGRLFVSDSNMGDHRLYQGGGLEGGPEIEIRSLDTFLRASDALPSIVKSDTQGFEANVLEGAGRLLDDGWRPIWLLEFWPFGLIEAGSDPMWMWDRLTGLHYEMYELHELHTRLVPLTAARLAHRMGSDISVDAQGFINILAFPDGSDHVSRVAHLVVEVGADG